MDWRCKGIVQSSLSCVPILGEELNYFLQRYVSRKIPTSNSAFMASLGRASKHLSAIQRHSTRSIDSAIFFEFGAGWEMTVPLAFYSFGVNRQIVIDKRKLMKTELVRDTVKKFEEATSSEIRRKPAMIPNGRDARAVLEDCYGITYRAPCDAAQTGLEPSTIDYITSTSTMEHIPIDTLRAILVECRRILRQGGLMSAIIDYDDHYSYFDAKISRYNFLKYSEPFWMMFNSELHFQNRLRHPDYTDLFRAAGFEIVEEQLKPAEEVELRAIAQLPLATRFRSYNIQDLAVHSAIIVARKTTKN